MTRLFFLKVSWLLFLSLLSFFLIWFLFNQFFVRIRVVILFNKILCDVKLSVSAFFFFFLAQITLYFWLNYRWKPLRRTLLSEWFYFGFLTYRGQQLVRRHIFLWDCSKFFWYQSLTIDYFTLTTFNVSITCRTGYALIYLDSSRLESFHEYIENFLYVFWFNRLLLNLKPRIYLFLRVSHRLLVPFILQCIKLFFFLLTTPQLFLVCFFQFFYFLIQLDQILPVLTL